MGLYNIQIQYLELMREAEENEGVLTDEQNTLLNITQEEFKEKANQFVKVIKQLESEVLFANNEIERIQKFVTTKENLKTRLKNALLEAIKLFGEKDSKKDIFRYETETFKLNTRKSEQVIISDEENIDNQFKEISVSKLSVNDLTQILDLLGKSSEELNPKTTISKTKIKNSIESGNFVEGAVIQENYSLQIK